MVEINSIGSPKGINPVLPMGRIVFGNPMIFQQGTDYNTKQPKVSKKTGLPTLECTFGFAIPKQGEQHWAETPWGALIYAEGATAFPTLAQYPDAIAWKIVDGDSPKPNKAGVPWNTKEGYPGHWVLTISSSLSSVKCFKANPQFGTTTECVSDKDIKTGDYGRLVISCKDNRDASGQAQTPGVYLNPIGFCMDKEGTAIVGEGVPTINAAAAFGGTVVSTPSQATPAYQPPVQQQATPAYQPPVQQQATPAYQPPVAPAQQNQTWSNPPPAPMAPPTPVVRMVNYQGQTVKADDLLAGGWTEEQIAQYTTAV